MELRDGLFYLSIIPAIVACIAMTPIVLVLVDWIAAGLNGLFGVPRRMAGTRHPYAFNVNAHQVTSWEGRK